MAENLEKHISRQESGIGEKPEISSEKILSPEDLESLGSSESGEKETGDSSITETSSISSPIASRASGSQERYYQVENILSDGLAEFYQRMNPADQQKFKAKGEEIARQITELTAKSKFKLKKVVTLIKSWLKLIPGVNRFFLEQTAKIKADKISQINNKN